MSALDVLSTQEWLERYDAVVAPVLPSYFDVVAARAEGSWVWDAAGRRYLDLGSGIAVTNTGHRHPHVVAAIHDQVDRLLHTSVVLKHQPYVEAAEAVARLAPYLGSPKVFFCNSGAEAVDGAIKLARRTTGRPALVAFRRAFHGRTLAATSLTTAKQAYRTGYDPLLPAVHVAPYCIPGPTGDHAGADADTAAHAAVAELDRMFDQEVAPHTVAAMIVEPVLGEGGYVVPPVSWLRGLRERCDRHGILLVFDEVQCGFGRTGRPFAAETFGVVPDVILFAKGVASGLPLGGILAGADLMDRWPTGAHGSTFGGNPVACAAAVATIEVLEGEGLYRRAVEIGDRMLVRLRADPSAAILEVRGIGAMVGVELVDKATAERVQRECLDAGVIVLTCGPEGNVLRLIPPLTISDAELDHGLDFLPRALDS
ncbi:MAG: aspartate aminotransferase family protein [Microthrixaceae bacterium]